MLHTKPALVLEGGAFRSQFTTGVLDVFMEHGIAAPLFETIYGVSAGALTSISYISGQVGRTNRINLAYRDNNDFIGFLSLFKHGSLVNSDILIKEINEEVDPFDFDAFHRCPTQLIAGVTNVETGNAEYMEVHALPNDYNILIATSSLPLVSKRVEIGDGQYLDGGTADAVPIERALSDGHPQALVILTQERSYRKGPYKQGAIAAHRYREFPAYVDALNSRPDRYNAQRETIFELERQGKILVLAPDHAVDLATVERDGVRLLELYIHGRQVAQRHLDKIRTFLNI